MKVDKMSALVKEYTSFSELIKAIDEQLNTLRQQLAEYLRRLEDIRAKAEQEKKLKEFIKTLTGEEAPSTAGKIIDLKSVKLYINPSAENESTLLEDLIDRINKSIQALQTARKYLEPLANIDIEAKITVIYKEGIPVAILIKY